MYNLTSSRGSDNTELSVLACRTLIGLSVAVSVLGFWSKGILPCVLLTAFLGATVFLASNSLGRLVAAFKVRDLRLVAQTFVLGAGFMALEGFLNHIGLAWLNAEYALGPAEAVFWGSFLLPAVNVFAVDTFTRDIPEPKADKEPQSKGIDLLLGAAVGPVTNLADVRRRQQTGEALDHIRKTIGG